MKSSDMSLIPRCITWGGVWPALVTPMHNDGSINYDNGTTGESPTITSAEFERLVRTAINETNKRVPVIVGTGSNCTISTIEKTRLASRLGASGCMVVVPYYNKPSQQGIIMHFQEVARAVPDTPLILYNVPGRTGVDMLPESTVAIAHACPNVVGHKEASGKFERYAQLVKALPQGFRLFTGEDGQACAACREGCVGVISVVANAMPSLMSAMVKEACAGRLQAAEEIDKHLRLMHEAAFCEPSPAPIKFALVRNGVISSMNVRGPLLPLTAAGQEKVTAAMAEAGKAVSRAGAEKPPVTMVKPSTSTRQPSNYSLYGELESEEDDTVLC